VWPSWTYFGAVIDLAVIAVAVMDLAVIVCGRNGLAVIVLRVAVMDFFWGPLSFVAVIAVAVMVCGRHGIDPIGCFIIKVRTDSTSSRTQE